ELNNSFRITELKEEFEQDIAHLDNALQKLPENPPGTVYRYSENLQGTFDNLKVGQQLDIPYYMSSAYDSEVPGFDKLPVRVDIETSRARIVPINMAQNEAIIPRNTRLKFLGETEIRTPTGGIQKVVQFQDVTDQSITRTLAEQLNQKEFYHGTKAQIDLRNIDPVQGGSRSELAVGIHFTDNPLAAKAYADATPNRNLPPVSTRKISEGGTVYNTRLNLNNVLDSTEPLKPEYRATMMGAVDHSNFTKQIKDSIKKVIKKPEATFEEYAKVVEDAIVKRLKPGEQFPEGALLNLQRNVTQRLRKRGVDAIYHKSTSEGVLQGNNLILLGNNEGKYSALDALPSTSPTDPVTQLTNRYNVDAAAHKQFNKSRYAKVNLVESRNKLQSQIYFETALKNKEIKEKVGMIAQDVTKLENKLKKGAILNNKEMEQARLISAEHQDATTVEHFNGLDEEPC
ncbi:MAG: hypothetical protein ACRDEA_04060, partial [Microcystaceae cyanobacterium]